MQIRSFVDTESVKWDIEVTAGNLLKACRGSGLTLNTLMSMEIPVETLLEALPCFCTRQLKERGLSKEDLLERIGPDQMKTFMEALSPSVEEAFPNEGDSLPEKGSVEDEAKEEAPKSPGSAKTS